MSDHKMSVPNPPLVNPSSQPQAMMGDAMPVGSVIAFAGEIRTSGNKPHETNLPMFNWLKCDGAKLKVANYPELFSALGYRYGGSGADFNIPDLRGAFLRGVGGENSKDPCFESRTGAKNGQSHEVGSTQASALQTHVHSYQQPKKAFPVIAQSGASTTQLPLMSAQTGDPEKCNTSQSETRPVNTFVYWLIKTK